MPPRIQQCLASLVLVLASLTLSSCGDDETEPPTFNLSPVLTGPTAPVGQVAPGEAVTLTLAATDPEGDMLTYAWTQSPATPAGAFSSTTVPSPTWTAPSVSTTQGFTLAVTVTDGRGGSQRGQVSLNVVPPVAGNTAPVITQRPSATPASVLGQQATTLAITATDADEDTLTYAWAQTPATPAGAFSSTSVANPTWTAPAVTGAQTFTLGVAVTDGRGGSVQDSVDVSVGVAQPNRAPTVAATITAPGTLLAGTTGTFSITASDEDGDTLTYAWEQEAPATQGTWVGALTGSSAQWYSPPVGTQTSFTLKVSVTDGKSAPVLRTVTVPVTVPRYATDIQPVFSVCTGCHGSSGGLSLAAGSSHGNLVNVNANNAACNTLKRVTPSAPGDSVLVRKMEGTACGNRMPRNNPTYFNTNPGLIVRVRSWILAGAAND